MAEPLSRLPQRLRGRTLLPGMVAQHWGRIVHIASGAARGGLYRQAGCSASRSGLLGLIPTRRLGQPDAIAARRTWRR